MRQRSHWLGSVLCGRGRSGRCGRSRRVSFWLGKGLALRGCLASASSPRARLPTPQPPHQHSQAPPLSASLFGIRAAPVVAVPLALRCAAPSRPSVHPTATPATDRRRHTGRPSPCPSPAARAALGDAQSTLPGGCMGSLTGNSHDPRSPPPAATTPTMARPPGSTLTRSTTTR